MYVGKVACDVSIFPQDLRIASLHRKREGCVFKNNYTLNPFSKAFSFQAISSGCVKERPNCDNSLQFDAKTSAV